MIRRILVIEDESSLLEEVLEWLNLEGYEAIGANNGREGVDRALDSHPDMIFSDVMMPKLDGYHVLMELRTHAETAFIPFVFLTAKADRRDMRYAMELGADDYITKPFTRAELLGAVETRRNKLETQRDLVQQDMAELRFALTRTLPHELRTPLMGILGYSELLQMDAENITPGQITEMAGHIFGAGQRLFRLVENYLLYAQLELSAIDPKTHDMLRDLKTSQPDTIIQQRAAEVAVRQARSNDLVVEVTAGDVLISDDELGKIITELVDNAFKFSGPGTTVRVSSRCGDGFYWIEISDQGRGMTAAEIERIAAFSQFNRAQFEQQGSGMGLIIAKRMLELFNGSLAIESVPNNHTTVTAHLPLVRNTA